MALPGVFLLSNHLTFSALHFGQLNGLESFCVPRMRWESLGSDRHTLSCLLLLPSLYSLLFFFHSHFFSSFGVRGPCFYHGDVCSSVPIMINVVDTFKYIPPRGHTVFSEILSNFYAGVTPVKVSQLSITRLLHALLRFR